MKKEVERKFLVRSDEWRPLAVQSKKIRQAYLDFCPRLTVRVRREDDKGFLTLKSASEDGGLTRHEWEKEIDPAEADLLIDRMSRGHVIEKTRYLVPWEGKIIEVDEFRSPRPGLVVAEIEFDSPEEARDFNALPPWLGREVTGDPVYRNVYMAQHG
ncbi:MAG: CYTH domain-containing protein [Chlorobi bacterium]|nr:CYTH domain-containing protein [Chlorobiota bacterium]